MSLFTFFEPHWFNKLILLYLRIETSHIILIIISSSNTGQNLISWLPVNYLSWLETNIYFNKSLFEHETFSFQSGITRKLFIFLSG